MADVQPGTIVTIAQDIVVNGALTFARGEQVTVQQVSPNPQRPEYKYTVQSARTGTWFQLRDADIVSQAPQQPQAPAQPQYATQPPPQGAARSSGALDLSMMTTPDWLIGIGGVVMLLGTFFYLWGFALLFPLLGLGVIVLFILEKFVKVPAITDWPFLSWVYVIIGGLGVLLAGLTLLRLLMWFHGLISVSWYFTPVLELLAAGAILAGGFMRVKEGQ